MENITKKCCYSKRPWMLQDDEELISLVQKRPEIWNASLERKRDLASEYIMWEEIAELVDRTMEEVKKRWDSLKSSYNEEQKRSNSQKEAGTTPLSFKLHEQLRFLSNVPSAKISLPLKDIEFVFVKADDEKSNAYSKEDEEQDPLNSNPFVNDEKSNEYFKEDQDINSNQSFGEFICHELNRFNNERAKQLKSEILKVCLEFKDNDEENEK